MRLLLLPRLLPLAHSALHSMPPSPAILLLHRPCLGPCLLSSTSLPRPTLPLSSSPLPPPTLPLSSSPLPRPTFPFSPPPLPAPALPPSPALCSFPAISPEPQLTRARNPLPLLAAARCSSEVAPCPSSVAPCSSIVEAEAAAAAAEGQAAVLRADPWRKRRRHGMEKEREWVMVREQERCGRSRVTREHKVSSAAAAPGCSRTIRTLEGFPVPFSFQFPLRGEGEKSSSGRPGRMRMACAPAPSGGCWRSPVPSACAPPHAGGSMHAPLPPAPAPLCTSGHQLRRLSSTTATAPSAPATPASAADGPLPFVLSADVIQEGCERTQLRATEFLTSLLRRYTLLARAPISCFHVAAIGLGESGTAYAGVNLEIPGLPLHHAVHAEQFVVANAMQHGERRIRQMLVNHPPCGHCRQFLQELRCAGDVSVVIADSHAETSSLHHFLPHPFGPHDLLHHDFPLLLDPRHNGLHSLLPLPLAHSHAHAHSHSQSHAHSHAHAPPKGTLSGDAASEEDSARAALGVPDVALAEAALGAANVAYAPYSQSPCGVSLRLSSGAVVWGAYLESAAFNPNLPPLQAAMVALVAQTGADFSSVVEAALVEVRGAQVQHADTTRLALAHLSPRALFTPWLASRSP